jgi:AraC-like DNA-binding protein
MGLVTSLFTLFNAFILFLGYGNATKGNSYLAVVFFVLATMGLASPEVLQVVSPLVGISIFPTLLPLNLLIGPFTFFYYRFIVKNISFKFSRDYVHLLPFLVFFINLFPYYLYSLPEKIRLLEMYFMDIFSPFRKELVFFGLSYYYLIGEVQMLFYLIICFIYLLKNKERLISQLQLAGYLTITRWLTFLYLALSLLFIMNVIIAVRSFYLGKNPESYYFFIVSSVLFFLNLRLYQYPTLMYGIKFKTSEDQKFSSLVNRKPKELDFDQAFSFRFNLLMNEWKETKAFLDPHFTLDSLANSLQSSPHKVRKFLKSELGFTFLEFKNHLRIQYFVETVKPEDLAKYSLSGLIKPYGFTNTSDFRALFDKYAPVNFDTFVANMKKNG